MTKDNTLFSLRALKENTACIEAITTIPSPIIKSTSWEYNIDRQEYMFLVVDKNYFILETDANKGVTQDNEQNQKNHQDHKYISSLPECEPNIRLKK